MMTRLLLLLLLLAPSGCGLLTDSGTELEYDPTTGKLSLERSWLGGPFYAYAEMTYPDGRTIRIHVESDNNLDAAGIARAGDQASIQTLAETVAKLATPTVIP